jgi:hypothetical protein
MQTEWVFLCGSELSVGGRIQADRCQQSLRGDVRKEVHMWRQMGWDDFSSSTPNKIVWRSSLFDLEIANNSECNSTDFNLPNLVLKKPHSFVPSKRTLLKTDPKSLSLPIRWSLVALGLWMWTICTPQIQETQNILAFKLNFSSVVSCLLNPLKDSWHHTSDTWVF